MKTNSKVHGTRNTEHGTYASSLVISHSSFGFTLIELLVVIAIIAILAAMIIPITGVVKKAKLRNRTEAEMNQIATAINNYKSKHGFYPPDNPGMPDAVNSLYYELSGMTPTNNGAYITLDRSASIDSATIAAAFPGKNGFMNSMQGKGGDEGLIAENFLKGALRADQVAAVKDSHGVQVNILVGTVGWPHGQSGELLPNQPAGADTSYNPWRYVSTNPTNNPTSFDLWIDIIVAGETNRFCNWDTKYKKPPLSWP